MFTGITSERVRKMTKQQQRWLENTKKAFYASDLAYETGSPQDACLAELCKAIDTAKTLRRSLRGEDTSPKDNRARFVEFLNLEIPGASSGGFVVELVDARTKAKNTYSFAELVYAVRCMVHENENLDAADQPEYHILVDWSEASSAVMGRSYPEKGRAECNGHLLWRRLREVLAKFITGIDGMAAYGRGEGFSISIDPPLGSIRPHS